MSQKYLYPKSRSGLKDVWNAFLCKGAKFTMNDIPYCPTILSDGYPKQILTWTEAKELHKKTYRKDKKYFCDAFVCFYIDDIKFDGKRSSVWLYPEISYRILKHFKGIITVDFSTYQDFPMPLKIYNTFRMRAFGYWAGTLGLDVINNIRWGTEETYWYCFDGVDKNSVVAIGTVGGSPHKIIDRDRFEKGLKEMIHILSPIAIIIYGSANYPCFDELRKQGIEIISYKSSTASSYERRTSNE